MRLALPTHQTRYVRHCCLLLWRVSLGAQARAGAEAGRGRRWPPRMVSRMQEFLALRSSREPGGAAARG
jgi:hypothetical protein